ncbi:uncharacterized protein isoform X2 [Musca autumnalis]
MAEFMSQHPSLAKGKFSCPEARACSNRLWEQLATKLNAAGPPIKNTILWRKVFTDQKHIVKKKLSFNKASKKQTGGGPYEEKLLTHSEELILEAAGLSAPVEGLSSVESFGTQVQRLLEGDDEVQLDLTNHSDDESINTMPTNVTTPINSPIQPTSSSRSLKSNSRAKSTSKISLLKENIEKQDEGRREQKIFWESLIEAKTKSLKIKEEIYKLKERSMKLKEEEHRTNIEIKKVELEIKNLQLNILKERSNLR